jgi:hypothetical protein
MLFAAADEGRHPDVAVEAWWWWGWNAPATAGVFVGLAAPPVRLLGRAGTPQRTIPVCRGTRRAACVRVSDCRRRCGLHACDVPFHSGASATGARRAADDPTEAWRRAYGSPVPVTFDTEWGRRAIRPRPHRYEQVGDIDARIELTEGARTRRPHIAHVWGVPYLSRWRCPSTTPDYVTIPSQRWGECRPGAHPDRLADVLSAHESRYPRRVRTATGTARLPVGRCPGR